jgi:hypothetical protein
MQWSDVADKQAISYNTLQSACDALVFLKLLNFPPDGKTGNQMIPAERIQSFVEIESAPLAGVPDNELVVKEQVVPVTRTYYKLIPCGAGGTAWTRIPPTLIGGSTNILNKRYILFGSPNLYWKWEGEFVGPQTSIPSGYNGSIQKIDNSIGCP